MHTGMPWDRGHIYRILHTPVYVGRVKHRENIYPGEHEAIIEVDLWDRVVAMLKEYVLHEEAQKRSLVPSLLKGIISCGYYNRSMSMISTTRDGMAGGKYLQLRFGIGGQAASGPFGLLSQIIAQSCLIRTLILCIH